MGSNPTTIAVLPTSKAKNWEAWYQRRVHGEQSNNDRCVAHEQSEELGSVVSTQSTWGAIQQRSLCCPRAKRRIGKRGINAEYMGSNPTTIAVLPTSKAKNWEARS